MSESNIVKVEKGPALPPVEELQRQFSSALKLVDDIVLKNYITTLPNLDVVELPNEDLDNIFANIRLFRITEMVYKKEEPATYKFASVFNAVAATNSAIITIIDSNGDKTDFYLGIRHLDNGSTATAYSTLVNAMQGQFPGAKTTDLKEKKVKELVRTFKSNSISAVTCVANNKNDTLIQNESFLQGLEKLVLGMQGKNYTAVIIANPANQTQLNQVRQGYENIYTQLSPFASGVVNYGTNTATSDTKTVTDTDTYSESDNESITDTKTIEGSTTVTNPTTGSKIGSTLGASLSLVGAVVGSIIPGAGTAAGAALGGIVGSAVGGIMGAAISAATNKTVAVQSGGRSQAQTTGTTITQSKAHSLGVSYGLTSGESQSLQLTVQNKPIIDTLKRIDKQLERLDEFESIGMWECAAYFLSADSSVSEAAAATYKALMSGENTGVEIAAINTWSKPKGIQGERSKNEKIADYVLRFMHPAFSYNQENVVIPVTPISLVSSNELAIHMGLPRHSIRGLPVIEHTDFGQEVVRYDDNPNADRVNIGEIFSMGRTIEGATVDLDVKSFSMHTFITGSTGSGKSNTVYTLLDAITSTRKDQISFMVIEPTKGEYKNVFGNKRNVSVFGTNPNFTELLRINPFRFPSKVHVLEHIDRLTEIFNVCWPMYAAMPAVLKDALLKAYEVSGWDLATSKNSVSPDLFPTFIDLQAELVGVIEESAYSQEVKSNYMGSLETRVNSLTNGLNGQIFSANEIDNKLLFDSNVIIDLSKVGSLETKALIMGILVMRLNEHRIANASGMNMPLKHITVLEEAHNILKRTSTEQNPESPSVTGKSVEMLSNAIAEMRTYGEGFIIADQSPNAVDLSAIRNTNTKIIMRLPDESDRRLSGKSAALKDEQLDELAKLPKGVAVIYQNDWVEPVLCKIKKYLGEETPYEFDGNTNGTELMYDPTWFNREMLKLLLRDRLPNPSQIRIDRLQYELPFAPLSTKNKLGITRLLKEYKATGKLSLWDKERFSDLSRMVVDLLGCEGKVEKLIQTMGTFDELNFAFANIVRDVTSQESGELSLAVSQCFMKHFAEEHPENLEIYSAWRNNLQ